MPPNCRLQFCHAIGGASASTLSITFRHQLGIGKPGKFRGVAKPSHFPQRCKVATNSQLEIKIGKLV